VPGALDDLTVLELANWVAGPSCAALMADMGANVIKIEPLGGDSMRGKLRQPASAEGAPKTDVPFHFSNRGKRGLAVDLANPEGGALVRELAAKSDVVITNLLPGRLQKFGLGAEQLRAENPRLVYALVTGYGSTGDDADRIAFDLTAFFGRGAIMSLIGEPGEPPPAFRPGQGDHPTGLALLTAILAALRVRDRTGEGQVVETALIRTAAWTIGCDVSVALVDKTQPTKRAREEAISPMNTRYRCADDVWVNLSTLDQGAWGRFCTALGVPELAEDERFATPVDRFRNGREVVTILDELFASQPYEHWAPRLDATGIIWGKVAELPDLIADPAARHLGMFEEIEHPTVGTFETLAAPFSMSSSEVAARGVGPEVPGEHSREVLASFGMDAERIDALLQSGVVGEGVRA
jgi:crotonobetainyl-CoA:carnitine CoA-transferase CaiB-like acyl-CoA transferase